MPTSEQIIFFDGVCILCNRSVQKIIRYDKKKFFKFAPIQGETSSELLAHLTEEEKMSGVIFYDRGKIYQGEIAIGKIVIILFPILKPFSFMIRISYFQRIMQLIYRYIAKKRYSWFGKYDSCSIPLPEERTLFLD